MSQAIDQFTKIVERAHASMVRKSVDSIRAANAPREHDARHVGTCQECKQLTFHHIWRVNKVEHDVCEKCGHHITTQY